MTKKSKAVYEKAKKLHLSYMFCTNQKSLFTLYFLFLIKVTFSQPFTIKLLIKNAYDQPLKNVSIKAPHMAEQLLTNELGTCIVNTNQSNTTFTISYFGYDTLKQTVRIKPKTKLNDTLNLTFILHESTQQLESVDIAGRRSLLAYTRPEILILDYRLTTTGLLLLIKEQKSYKIRLTDSLSNTLGDILIKNKPKRFFTDCFDQFHLVYEDSVAQLNIDDTKISLQKPISLNQFNYYIEACTVSTPTHLYFSELGTHNQTVIHYSINKSTKEKVLVKRICDEKKELFSERTLQTANTLQARALSDVGEIWINELKIIKQAKQYRWYYSKILTIPTYNPLIKTTTGILLFDHVNDTLFTYNYNGILQQKKGITYHLNRNWQKQILYDHIKNQVYAVIRKDGMVYLEELDIETGQIIHDIKIQHHAFPENMQVKNGYLYYLYTELGDFNLNNLYRQCIKN